MVKPSIEWVDEVVDQAYHGTDLSTADKIAAGNRFQPSRGPDHWLGDGVYFFQDSIVLAVKWAKRKAKEKQSKEYGVLKASILLGKCLDLTTQTYKKQLEKWINLLQCKTKLDLTESWIINSFARKYRGGFDTVRCRFPGFPGELPFRSSRSKRSYIQISVLQVDNISNVVRVEKGKR